MTILSESVAACWWNERREALPSPGLGQQSCGGWRIDRKWHQTYLPVTFIIFPGQWLLRSLQQCINFISRMELSLAATIPKHVDIHSSQGARRRGDRRTSDLASRGPEWRRFDLTRSLANKGRDAERIVAGAELPRCRSSLVRVPRSGRFQNHWTQAGLTIGARILQLSHRSNRSRRLRTSSVSCTFFSTACPRST